MEWHRCQTHRPIGFKLLPSTRKAKEPQTNFEEAGMGEYDSTDEEEREKENEQIEVITIDEKDPDINATPQVKQTET